VIVAFDVICCLGDAEVLRRGNHDDSQISRWRSGWLGTEVCSRRSLEFEPNPLIGNGDLSGQSEAVPVAFGCRLFAHSREPRRESSQNLDGSTVPLHAGTPCNDTQEGYFLSVQSMMLTRFRFRLVLHRGDRATFRHLETSHQVQLLRSKAGCTGMSFGRPLNSERQTVATTELYAPEIHGLGHYITGYVLIVGRKGFFPSSSDHVETNIRNSRGTTWQFILPTILHDEVSSFAPACTAQLYSKKINQYRQHAAAEWKRPRQYITS
jgi:hypothetical protein